MPAPSLPADLDVDTLIALWTRERDAELTRFRAERDALPPALRLARGLALAGLVVDEVRPAPGGRVTLCVAPARADHPFTRQHVRLRPGDPVVLFRTSPDAPDAVPAIVGRWHGNLLGLLVDAAASPDLEAAPFRLEREAPATTFARGLAALQALRAPRGDLARLVAFAAGRTPPEPVSRPPSVFFDPALDAPQQAAITSALTTGPISLIHGPPGTGKTRCLVEVVRQALAAGLRVLVTAPSNTAVDNLAERLHAASLDPLRLGHPARVDPAIADLTLDARLDATDAARLAAGWLKEAHQLRARTERQAARGTGDRDARRDAFRECRRLEADARTHLRRAEHAIVASARVVCATLTLAAHPALSGEAFDLVVLDEATQAVDPLAWIALSRAPRAILAGDPHQLPPTLVDPDVARSPLGTSLFERLHARHGDAILRMLTTQHRMHTSIMAFPSDALYGGRLVAHPDVAGHTLDMLPDLRPDPFREAPLVFIDCAGAGWFDARRQPDGSTYNPELAARTAREVHRLLSVRGLSADRVGVITPYDAEASHLRELLADAVALGLEVSSIDGFQGREKEAIVVDLVRSNDDADIGFLADVRRMNVALTRARRFLVILGDSATVGGHPFYANLLDHVEAYGLWLDVFSDDGTLGV